jgi:hypothetical protein
MEKGAEIADIARPYKIMISLLDRAEVGTIVLNNSFIDILASLKASCEGDAARDEIIQKLDRRMSMEEGYKLGNERKEDILQAANVFVGMVDPFIVGHQLYKLILNDPTDENLELIMFYITECTCDDEESRFILS